MTLATIEERTERFETVPAWAERRKLSLGSSDVAAILGLSNWASPLSVYLEKTGKIPDVAPSDAKEDRFWWGHRMEAPIAERFAMKAGLEVTLTPRTIVRNPRCDFMHSSPDGWAAVPGGSLVAPTSADFEAKTDESPGARGQFDEGTPEPYRVQGLCHMAASGRDLCYFGVKAVGPFFWLREERNEELIAWIEDECSSFWHTHVLADVPPEPDGSAATRRALRLLHPKDDGTTIVLPADAEVWHATIERTRDLIKNLKAEQDQARAHLEARIGSATFGSLPDGGGYSWKHSARKGYEVKPSETRTLRFSKKIGGKR